MISPKIFNTEKSLESYKHPSLFLGEDTGLFDTVNKRYPKIWGFYKEMKSLDWSEDEFDYSQCLIDFKTCPKDTADFMIETLAWQWEADTVASRSTIGILAPLVSSSEAWAAYQRISDNEVVHAATYSEIVRMSFDNPDEVIKKILSAKESLTRLESISKVFEDMRIMSLRYALGEIDRNDEALYHQIILMAVATLMLERIQFMASFAITFSICGTGLFQPIGKAIQKIAQDELEVHSEFGKEVIRTEKKTERGARALEILKPKIQALFDEVIESELSWLDHLFSNGRSLIGTNLEICKKWVLFNARDVSQFLGLTSTHKLPKVNPMPYMETWLNMNKTQSAPQEQDQAAYKVGSVFNDDESSNFDVDF